MTDPNRILTAARDVLARAKDARPQVNPRALRRLEQKIRLTEHALAAARAPAFAGTTQSGLRAVLARAEARLTGRALSPEQARAIDGLRAQIARLEAHGAAVGEELDALVASLAADTERVRAEAEPKTRAKGAGKAEPKSKAAAAKERARARKEKGARRTRKLA